VSAVCVKSHLGTNDNTAASTMALRSPVMCRQSRIAKTENTEASSLVASITPGSIAATDAADRSALSTRIKPRSLHKAAIKHSEADKVILLVSLPSVIVSKLPNTLQ